MSLSIPGSRSENKPVAKLSNLMLPPVAFIDILTSLEMKTRSSIGNLDIWNKKSLQVFHEDTFAGNVNRLFDTKAAFNTVDCHSMLFNMNAMFGCCFLHHSSIELRIVEVLTEFPF